MQKIFDRIQGKKKRIVFAEGEEERVIRAAVAFKNAGYGEPIMVAREHRLKETIERIGLEGADDLICINAKISDRTKIILIFFLKSCNAMARCAVIANAWLIRTVISLRHPWLMLVMLTVWSQGQRGL